MHDSFDQTTFYGGFLELNSCGHSKLWFYDKKNYIKIPQKISFCTLKKSHTDLAGSECE